VSNTPPKAGHTASVRALACRARRPVVHFDQIRQEHHSPNNLYAGALRAGTVLNAAKTVLDRTEKLNIAKPPDDTLIDVTKLSTPLLRMLKAELRQIQQRQSHTVAAVPSPTPGSAQGPPSDDAAH
jgi:hypothetical protein